MPKEPPSPGPDAPAKPAPAASAEKIIQGAPRVVFSPENPAPDVSVKPSSKLDPEASESEEAVADSIRACRDKFQEVYIEMYLSLNLASDFGDLMRAFDRRLDQGTEPHRLVFELGMSPVAAVWTLMSGVVDDLLTTGNYHIDKGFLGLHGQELFNVYRYSINALQNKGFVTLDEAQSKIFALEKKIEETE
jgi:hypothetical protein